MFDMKAFENLVSQLNSDKLYTIWDSLEKENTELALQKLEIIKNEAASRGLYHEAVVG